jgi:hypothetical protein
MAILGILAVRLLLTVVQFKQLAVLAPQYLVQQVRQVELGVQVQVGLITTMVVMVVRLTLLVTAVEVAAELVQVETVVMVANRLLVMVV